MDITEPNYPVIELEAENVRLKDELIDTLKKRVDDLTREVQYLRDLINWKKDETDQGSHMIAPPVINVKPRYRTVSEVAKALEARSLNAANARLSAEDIEKNAKKDV